MRKTYVFLLLAAGYFLADCGTHRKIKYNIPEDIQGKDREALMKSLEEGRKLYEMHCSGCHGIFTKGKDGMPDFTNSQIDTYTAWAIKKDPKNHAVAAHMDSEQLHEVFMFLKARKIKQANPEIKKSNAN
jgi:mono/diheme cytochrome c family protein